MNLLKEVNDDIEEVEPEKELPSEIGPATPDGWSVGHLGSHGLILSCDGFQLKLEMDELQKFFDIAESGDPGEIKDQNGKIILVEPTSDSIVLTRTGDEVYPNGVVLDLHTLKELGVEQHEIQDDDEDQDENVENDDTISNVKEAVKAAFRRAGNKIKRGFRVTSGSRKGRVVANIRTAYKPRAKASTRMKLSIAGRKHKVIRVLKSKRTRKKSISKRLHRMNEDSGITTEDYIQMIKRDCQPFLNQLGNNKSLQKDVLAYRGIKNLSGKVSGGFYKLNVRQDRKPMSTSIKMTRTLDEWFERKFEFKARTTSLFSSGSFTYAQSYGDIFAIFPIGEFKFVWSPEVTDLFLWIDSHFFQDYNDKAVYKSLDGLNYTNQNLKKALKDGKEIMISCKQYYAVRVDTKAKAEELAEKLKD